eukprot:gene6164-7137_t
MAQIARALDEEERKVMSAGGMDSTDFIKFAAEGSGNVADDGFYSQQVLEKALSNFNLTCTSINNKDLTDVVSDPLKEEGFICNLSEHWFTLRKIDGKWFDLNSIKKPTFLSEFHIGQQGWSIFVVRGEYPSIIPFSQAEYGTWMDISPTIAGSNNTKTNKSPISVEDYDPELEQALKLSLQYSDDNETYNPVQQSRSNNSNEAFTLIEVDEYERVIDDDEDEELNRAIAASLRQN